MTRSADLEMPFRQIAQGTMAGCFFLLVLFALLVRARFAAGILLPPKNGLGAPPLHRPAVSSTGRRR
jgi:hypothetical protein